MTLGSMFHAAGSFFAKVFTKAQPATTIALSTIQTFGPDLEIVWALIDPASEAAAAPIINEITADLGSVAILLKSGNTNGVAGFLGNVKVNLAALLAESHIKNPDSVARAQGIINALSAEITHIQSAVATP